jgi:alkyl hydroperoxide reductase subunit AhpC
MPFPLLADFFPHGQVAQLYETLNEESGTARRATFLIDKEGIMRWNKLSGQPDIEELIALLKEL